jgi:hypothetical protein
VIGPPAVLLNVAQALPKKRQNMFVIKRIEDHPALTPRSDDSRIAKQTQLMRDGGFGYAELEREITDAQLRARQGIEDPHTSGVTEHAKDLGQSFDCVRIES